jgi:hypothetical protein
MGSSCSCNNIFELKQELDILKERKRNRDFFIDYNMGNIKQKENIEYDNKIRTIKTDSINSNNNDLVLFSTQSYTNMNNIFPFFRNDSYGTGSNEIIIEKDKIKEKEIIIENDKENENEDEDENRNYKTQIQLKPKRKIILNRNINTNEDKNENKNEDIFMDYENKNEDIFRNYGTTIIKNKVIYTCSNDFITKKKYEDEMISEEEYNYEPDDNYSKVIFNYINKLRKNPKKIANIIEENKKFIIIDENNKIYFKKNSIKYKLEKGYQTFDETIKILNNLEPMKQLIYNKNITIKIPDNEDEINNNCDYLKNQIEELQNKGNHISSYWCEIIKDPEISFLMMVVDDNHIKSGLKRNDLINPDIKYIGIISFQKDNNFRCYITLSTRK